MIYHLRAISNECEDFVLDIAIDSQFTFLELHDFIQEKLDYDPSHMASFFTTDEDWQKEHEVTLIDMDEEAENTSSMEKTHLEDLLTRVKQRLLYAFDLFSERVLFMELSQIDEGTLQFPVCTKLRGITPVQFSESDFPLDGQEVNNDSFHDDDDMDDLYNGYEDLDNYSDEEYDDDNLY